jgi:hypothetical protein
MRILAWIVASAALVCVVIGGFLVELPSTEIAAQLDRIRDVVKVRILAILIFIVWHGIQRIYRNRIFLLMCSFAIWIVFLCVSFLAGGFFAGVCGGLFDLSTRAVSLLGWIFSISIFMGIYITFRWARSRVSLSRT